MKLKNMAISGLAIPVLFILMQDHAAFGDQNVIINQAADPECRFSKTCFLPYEAVIENGQKVTWYNDDSSVHSIISKSQKFGPSGIITSGSIMPGESFSYKFDSTGYIKYYCAMHPWMNGIVLVK